MGRRYKHPKDLRDYWRVKKAEWRRKHPEKDKEITQRAIRKRRLKRKKLAKARK